MSCGFFLLRHHNRTVAKKTSPRVKPEIHFYPIKETVVMSRMLELSVKRKSIVTVWLKKQALKFESSFIGYYPNLQRLFLAPLPNDVSSEQFFKLLDAQPARTIFGSLTIQAVMFFFRMTIEQNRGERGLQISLPIELYKLQRRQYPRIPFERKVAPTISLVKPSKRLLKGPPGPGDFLKFRILDVSVGGISFAVAPEHHHLFTLDTFIEEMHFTIKHFDMRSEGRVTYVSKLLNDFEKTFFRIGVEFYDLHVDFEKHIGRFIEEESRNLFSMMF